MEPFSFSRISSYLRCPYAYKLQFKDKLPRTSDELAEAGRLAHEIFEQYAKHCVQHGHSTDLEFGRKLIREKAVGLSPRLIVDLVNLSERFLETHQFPRPAKIETKIGLTWRPRERAWEKVGFKSKKAIYRGVIDYLEPRLEEGYVLVMDYKSGRLLPDLNSLEHDMQLLSYALMASVLYPEAEYISCILDFVRYNYRLPEVQFDRARIDEFSSFLRKTIADINEVKKFEPRYEARCDWCDFLHSCKRYKKAVKGTDIPLELKTLDDAVKLASHLRLLKAGAKRIDQRLRKWVDENGPIVLGNQELNFHLKPKRSFPDSEKVVDILLDLDVPREAIWEELGITVKGLEKLAKKHKLTDEDKKIILGMAVNKPHTDFRFQKVKQAEEPMVEEQEDGEG